MIRRKDSAESNATVFVFWCIFFFQEEDGIRYSSVTGVKTCALPIYLVCDRQAGIRGGQSGHWKALPRTDRAAFPGHDGGGGGGSGGRPGQGGDRGHGGGGRLTATPAASPPGRRGPARAGRPSVCARGRSCTARGATSEIPPH